MLLSIFFQDPSKKDFVEVTRKQTARKPSIEIEGSMTGTNSNKLPPDPIGKTKFLA